jgi:uncharacterized protein (TIGR02147 family)
MLKPYPSIYLFTDYRAFLGRLYEESKGAIKGFSYRTMAPLLGISSAGTLKLIIDGKRRLTPKAALGIGAALNFSTRQQHYLDLLVQYERAKTIDKRNHIFSEISYLREHAAAARIESNQYRYLSAWYNAVIRELVKQRHADSVDYEALAAQLIPPITPAQARKSVELLRELGMIYVNESGTYAVKTQFIQTPLEIQQLAVRKYHHDMLKLADESIEKIPSEKREISSLTLYLAPTTFDRIKQRIRAFEDEVVAMVMEDKEADRVYQLNFQLFPVALEEPNAQSKKDVQ